MFLSQKTDKDFGLYKLAYLPALGVSASICPSAAYSEFAPSEITIGPAGASQPMLAHPQGREIALFSQRLPSQLRRIALSRKVDGEIGGWKSFARECLD